MSDKEPNWDAMTAEQAARFAAAASFRSYVLLRQFRTMALWGFGALVAVQIWEALF